MSPYFGAWAATLALALGCRDAAGPRWVADLRITPDSVHLAPGETASFVATPLDQRGDELPDRATWVEWRISAPAVARLESAAGEASVTSLEVGDARIGVALGRGTEEAEVFVHPGGLDRIEMEPSIFDIPIGTAGATEIRARLLDAAGAELPTTGFRISWTTGDIDIAYVGSVVDGIVTGPTAVLRARTPGQTSIRLVVNDRSVSSPVVAR